TLPLPISRLKAMIALGQTNATSGCEHRLEREDKMSRTKCFAIVASVAAVTLGAATVGAQQPPPQSPSMTFFVTSAGLGKGADLGGLDGADKQCQALAQAAGAGSKTWRAYLSTQAVAGAAAF